MDFEVLCYLPQRAHPRFIEDTALATEECRELSSASSHGGVDGSNKLCDICVVIIPGLVIYHLAMPFSR